MPQAKITITLSKQGEVRISGNINDRFTSYAMLDAAREILFIRAMEEAFGLHRSKVRKIIEMPDLKS